MLTCYVLKGICMDMEDDRSQDKQSLETCQHHVVIDWSDAKPTTLFMALLQAQADMPPIKEHDYNPHFKNRYAQYKDIVDTVRETLHAHGLLFFHQPSSTDNALYTYIVHAKSGQWMRGALKLMPAQRTEQARGSSISYVKRYSLIAMLGLATRDDDDGNAASQRGGAK